MIDIITAKNEIQEGIDLLDTVVKSGCLDAELACRHFETSIDELENSVPDDAVSLATEIESYLSSHESLSSSPEMNVDKIAYCIEQYAKNREQSAWIKCTPETLPADDEYVWWVFENGNMFYGCIDHDMDADCIEKFLRGNEHTGRITHWRKAPELPEEEDGE